MCVWMFVVVFLWLGVFYVGCGVLMVIVMLVWDGGGDGDGMNDGDGDGCEMCVLKVCVV